MGRNSALIWEPAVKAAGLPSPPTIMVPYDHMEIAGAMEDNQPCPAFPMLCEVVDAAAREIGYPVFIRTDLSSAKHSGSCAWSAGDGRDISCALSRTIEDNEMKFWMSRERPQAIMIRKLLALPASFSAFRGLPISQEWRFFADADEVICAHPYWPEEALERHVDGDVSGWREDLAVAHAEPLEMAELRLMAVRAAVACGGGRWSVDFARDHQGKWWLLDMAVMADSWHWPGCPNAAVSA